MRVATALTYSVDEIQNWIEETFDFDVFDDPTIGPSDPTTEHDFRFGVAVEGDMSELAEEYVILIQCY